MRLRIRFQAANLILCATFLLSLSCLAQSSLIQLPQPQISGGMPLQQALAQRQTSRSFASKPLKPPAALDPPVVGLRRESRPRRQTRPRPHRSLGHEPSGG